MRNGGYKIIDLKDVSLNGTAKKVAGLHEEIENSYRKPLLVSGIVINGVERNDMFAEPLVSGNSYVFHLYSGKITVTNQDMVTYVADAQE